MKKLTNDLYTWHLMFVCTCAALCDQISRSAHGFCPVLMPIGLSGAPFVLFLAVLKARKKKVKVPYIMIVTFVFGLDAVFLIWVSITNLAFFVFPAWSIIVSGMISSCIIVSPKRQLEAAPE